MRWYDLLLLSLQNLWRRKLRTVLTMVGVMIGTCSIVVMLSIGLGANKAVTDQAESMDSLTIITINDYSAYERGAPNDRVKLDDNLIRQFDKIEHVVMATPVMRAYGDGNIETGRYSSWMNLTGIKPGAFEKFDIPLMEGRALEPSSTKLIEITLGTYSKSNFQKKNSNVWGQEPDIDWLNAKYSLNLNSYNSMTGDMTTKKYKLQVVGITGSADERNYSQHDSYSYVDIDVLKRLVKENPKSFYSSTTDGSYEECWVKVDDYRNVEKVMDQLKEGNTLQVSSPMEWINSMKKSAQNTQLLLGGIGSITMLVAAISIANTMLMSIYERTREIGVMKVLGCRLSNISLLFLGEAAFIGLFGGAVGVGLSYGLSSLLNFIFAYYGSGGYGGMQSYLPPWLSVLALFFAVLVGILSGLYPSQRAMRLSALAAIRNDV